MTLSQKSESHAGLTPDNAVLVLIDHQVGLMSIIRDMSPQEATANILGLAKSAQILGLPVLLTTNIEWGLNGRLVPELRRIFPSRPVIGRPGVLNAWNWPAFREAVVQGKRRKVIMAGVTVSTGLLFAALDMLRDGYEVHAVIDASGAESTLARDLAVATLLHAGARTRSWFSVATELLGDWRHDLEKGSPLAFGAMTCVEAWGNLLRRSIDQAGSDRSLAELEAAAD